MTRPFLGIAGIAKWSWLQMGCILALGLILSGCGQGPAPDNSASNLMPVLADYNSETTLDIQNAISKLGSAAALAGAQVEVAASVQAVDGLLTCYEKAGAIVGQAYVNKTNPLYAGLIIIVNKNVLTNPQTFLSCLAPKTLLSAPNGSTTTQIQPCTHAYTLNQNGNTFYIAYIGTNSQVCASFCSGLQGCTAP